MWDTHTHTRTHTHTHTQNAGGACVFSSFLVLSPHVRHTHTHTHTMQEVPAYILLFWFCHHMWDTHTITHTQTHTHTLTHTHNAGGGTQSLAVYTSSARNTLQVGLTRTSYRNINTAYIRRTYDFFSRGPTMHTAIYSVQMRFWPALNIRSAFRGLFAHYALANHILILFLLKYFNLCPKDSFLRYRLRSLICFSDLGRGAWSEYPLFSPKA